MAEPHVPNLAIFNPLMAEDHPVDTEQGGIIKMVIGHLNPPSPETNHAQGLRWPDSTDDHLNPSVSDGHLNPRLPNRDLRTKEDDSDKDIKMANPETRDLAILINEGDDGERWEL